jgi:hypothetical protein
MQSAAGGRGTALLPEIIAEARRPQVGVAVVAGPEICWEPVVATAAGGRTAEGPPGASARAFRELLYNERHVMAAGWHLG